MLLAVRSARAFNRWMSRQIAPYVGQRVLEAGCGIGNFTELLLDRERLVASDNDPFYVEMINWRFGHLENVRAVQIDLTRREDYAPSGRRAARHDRLPERARAHRGRRGGAAATSTICCEPGGHAIILVPQHPWLYTPSDKRSATSGATPRTSCTPRSQGGLRGRAPAGIQPPGHAGLVRQRQAAGQDSTCRPARCGPSTGSCR